MVMEPIRMKQVLPQKNWDSIETLNALDALNPKVKEDLCTIFLDVHCNPTEIYQIIGEVVQRKSKLVISFKKFSDLNDTLGTILIKSDPEMMTCLADSQEDKKTGNYRKFSDIVRECNL